MSMMTDNTATATAETATTGTKPNSGLSDTEYRFSVKFSASPNSSLNSASPTTTTQSTSNRPLKPEYTVEQQSRVDRHLARLGVGRGRERDGGDGLGWGVGAGVGAGPRGVGEEVSGGLEREEVGLSTVGNEEDQQEHTKPSEQGTKEVPYEARSPEGSAKGSSSLFIPSRRKRRAVPFPSNELRVGSGLSAVDQVAGPSSSSSSTSSTSTTTNSRTPSDRPKQTEGKEGEDGYTLILRGCMDGRWRGEGNYRCTRVWPGREGSSAALHAGRISHTNTSRSSPHGNKKSSTPTQSTRTRPKRGASSTRASESVSTPAATAAAARIKGESPAPSSSGSGGTSGGKPLLIVPGLTTGPSPSPLRMAYSQPNSPEEGVSSQSLSTLDVSRVLRASSESGLGVGESVGGGGKKRRRGSAMEESTSGLDPTDLGGRSDIRSASSPPAKKVARSGLGGGMVAGSVAGVRVSPRLSHAVPVIPDEMKVSPQSSVQRDEAANVDEIADPITPLGKRYTELSEQEKETFRATWPLEHLSAEEWDRRTNGEWSRLSEADRTALEETTDQDRRRMLFAHLEKGQANGSPLATAQNTSGSSSDLGRALLKRELEAKKRLEGRAATCSPPRTTGGEGETGGLLDQDVDGSDDGKRASNGGTSMRRTLSHDTATLSRPRAPSRRGSSEVEPPVSMASSRSRREVGPPRHLRDYETEIVV